MSTHNIDEAILMSTHNIGFHEDLTNEPHHEKTNVWHMRKQRRRSASR